MKPATHTIFEISKQRGFWLRCFLDRERHNLHTLDSEEVTL